MTSTHSPSPVNKTVVSKLFAERSCL